MVAQTPDKPDWAFAVIGLELIDFSLGHFARNASSMDTGRHTMWEELESPYGDHFGRR